MDRRYISALVLILLTALPPGCSRSREAGVRPEQKEIQPGSDRAAVVEEETKGTTPPFSEDPGKNTAAHRSSRERAFPAAFFSVDDSGPRQRAPDLYDYELGRVIREIPAGLEPSLARLGQDLPEAYLAPEWREHLMRQTEIFDESPGSLYLSDEKEEGGSLSVRFKAVFDERIILGFLRARKGEDGGYLLEDLSVNRILEKPYPKIEIPPPIADNEYW
jgi:hypothetical protein